MSILFLFINSVADTDENSKNWYADLFYNLEDDAKSLNSIKKVLTQKLVFVDNL